MSVTVAAEPNADAHMTDRTESDTVEETGGPPVKEMEESAQQPTKLVGKPREQEPEPAIEEATIVVTPRVSFAVFQGSGFQPGGPHAVRTKLDD